MTLKRMPVANYFTLKGIYTAHNYLTEKMMLINNHITMKVSKQVTLKWMPVNIYLVLNEYWLVIF